MRFAIPHEHFADFLTSMRMDLTVTEYPTFADLSVYVHGSAAVIGREMVHVLGATDPADLPEALDRADDLGVAFQLANFIRDVGEDLERGRVYLPLDELERFAVSRADLERRVLTPQIRLALEFQVRRVRQLQARAEPGIALLRPEAQPCIEAASELYCGIVDAVEDIDYQVFDQPGDRRQRPPRPGRRRRVAGGSAGPPSRRLRPGQPAAPVAPSGRRATCSPSTQAEPSGAMLRAPTSTGYVLTGAPAARPAAS